MNNLEFISTQGKNLEKNVWYGSILVLVLNKHPSFK